ncbi:MAG: SPFH domain-containing protein [Thermodesulfobacteriota bacterium]|nr:SPFH domain-containing protein [Thermodesulfobacteriota bacterium]
MFKKEFFIIFVLVFLASAFGCTNPNTPAGHEGFVYEKPRFFGKGGFRGVTKGPGNYGVSLWRNAVINIDLRPNTYAEQFKILAKDDLNVSFRFHAIISLKPGSIQDVIQKYGGKNWYKRFVKEPFRTFVRNAVQQYDSRAIKEKRDVIANEVESKMQNHLKESPFQLVSLVVGNIDYPDVVAKAVEEKLAAQQLLEEKKVQKEIAKRDAEIRIEEAKGIAQAQKIINATLTSNYLQHEAIQTQKAMADSPNHTTVYIPVGPNGIPLVYTPKR